MAVRAAEDQSIKICINREKLERLKIKIAEYSTIFPDSAPTLKKIDEKLVELNKNRQL
jgi:outer membrane usher protein FimD/PapC